MTADEMQLAMTYYSQLADQMAGLAVRTDSIISATKHRLRQKQQGFSLLSALHQLIRTQMEPSRVYRLTIEKINTMLKMDCTVVFTPADQSHTFRPTSWLGVKSEVSKGFDDLVVNFQEMLESTPGALLVHRKSDKTDLVTRLQEVLHVPYFICLPIVINDKVEGILLSGRLKEVKPFYPPLDHGDLDTFQAIAGFLSAALTNSKLFTDLEALEQRYRSIFENALEGIFQSTPEGRFINVNPALAEMYGYDSPEDLTNSITNIGEQIYVDSEKRQEFQTILDTQETLKEFEYRCYRKDGRIIWTQIDARVVKDSAGKVLYYEGIVQDITERKQREDALKRQLEELEIEIDQQKREEAVATLVGSSYFQEVQKEIAEVDLDEFWG